MGSTSNTRHCSSGCCGLVASAGSVTETMVGSDDVDIGCEEGDTTTCTLLRMSSSIICRESFKLASTQLRSMIPILIGICSRRILMMDFIYRSMKVRASVEVWRYCSPYSSESTAFFHTTV